MIGKVVFILAVCLAVTQSGNPAVGKPWTWKRRYPTASPNIRNVSFSKIFSEEVEIPYVPGTWTAAGSVAASVEAETRIVGGTEATPHAFPWQVALFLDETSFCGGSLISDEWILTAAHCTSGRTMVQIILGAHDLGKYESTQVVMTSFDFFEHEGWNPDLLGNDLALVRLPKKVIFNSYIQYVYLPHRSDQNDNMVGKIVTASGWGMPSDAAWGVLIKLRTVNIPVISNEECIKASGILPSKVLCTSGAGGRGACFGDSGGPLTYKTRGRREIRGVVSFETSEKCEDGTPNGYTSVTAYLDWIETKTGIAVDD
ncbi:chymotrypsin BI-like isoform X2 [Oratosquilla oratoria]|uniref:chymotrypsin BI-like isoform X2 n=1 Tax=Oratosquilla oratoria TaxID=337810 RepID=UPI003F77818B